jgi:hypothetical protein
LELDLASSYVMTIFGNYMSELLERIKLYISTQISQHDDFVHDIFLNYDKICETKCVILKYTKKNKKLINKLFCEKIGYTIKTDFSDRCNELSNSLVGIQYKQHSSDAHWIYIDSNGYIYNSYNNGLQVNGTNQFCQCYALLMALHPFYRNDFSDLEYSYKFGYSTLLKLWNYLFDVIFDLSFSKETKFGVIVHDETTSIIKNVNKFENPQIVKIILNEVIGNDKNFALTNIKKILNSEYALDNAPYFE